MFRGSYTAGSVAFLLLSTTLPAFCLRIFPQNASRLMVGGTALAPGFLHTKPPRLPSRKPGRFVCFRGAFSGAHAKPCEGSFGKPRVCGEKPVCIQTRTISAGSPPRMRGKVDRQLDVGVHAGITPACAGKSVWQRLPLAQARDHPRVCGEKILCFFHGLGLPGSPPRMRGKGHLTLAVSHMHRITPADAGKRQAPTGSAPPSWDHPRVCGEKFSVLSCHKIA